MANTSSAPAAVAAPATDDTRSVPPEVKVVSGKNNQPEEGEGANQASLVMSTQLHLKNISAFWTIFNFLKNSSPHDSNDSSFYTILESYMCNDIESV